MILFHILSILSLSLLIFQVTTALLFYHKRKFLAFDKSPTYTLDVILCAYNEDPQSLHETIESIQAQQKVKTRIIVVDDGSKRPVSSYQNIMLLRSKSNQGKRNALYWASHFLENPFVAVVDSDTILDPLAMYHLCQEMTQHDTIGAVCSNVKIRNVTNRLTSIISAMYWYAFSLERASQSFLKSQLVCAGALSLYRKNVFKAATKALTEQKVLGLQCVAGDDRHLTSQTLSLGYETLWSPEAIVYTNTPDRVKTFIKQQLRWTRSCVLETIWASKNFSLFNVKFWFLMYKTHHKYVYSLLLYILLITHFSYFVIPFLLGLIIISLFKGIFASVLSKDALMILRTAGLSMFGYFLLSPILLYGCVTFWKTGWGSRTKRKL